MPEPAPQRRGRLWTWPYLSLMLASFAGGLAHHVTNTVSPLLAVSFEADKTAVGALMMAFTVAALLFRPLFGALIDRRGGIFVYVLGISIATAATTSIAAAAAYPAILAARTVQGIGFSAYTTASGALAAAVVPRERMAEGIGYFGISTILAMAVGPVMGLDILRRSSFQSVFLSTTAIGAAAAAVAFAVRAGLPAAPAPSGRKDRRPPIDWLVEISAIPPSLVMLFIAFALGGIVSFLPLCAISRGVGNIGPFYMANAAAMLVARPLAAPLADRFGYSLVLVPGLALLAASFAILSLAASLPAFLAAAVLYGIGYGGCQPVLNAVVFLRCPPERRGAGSSTFFAAMDFGVGAGSLIAGFVAQYLGYSALFAVLGTSFLVAYAAYRAILRPSGARPARARSR